MVAICRREVNRAPTFRVVINQDDTLYRGQNFTLAVYATDENGCHLNVSGTAALTLVGADGSDNLYDNTSALSTITIANGIWTSSTITIDDGSGPETGVTISCAATSYTTASSDSFSLSEYGVISTFDADTLAGNCRGGFTDDDDYIWYGGDKTDASLLRINKSDFSTYVSYDVAAMGGNADALYSLSVGSTYILFNTKSLIAKVTKSDMTTNITTAFNHSFPRSTIYSTNVYGFASGRLETFLLANLSSTADTADSIYAVATDGTSIWTMNASTKYLEKRAVATLAVATSVNLSTYIAATGASENSILYDDGYVYIGSQGSHTVVKVNATTMVFDSEYDNANLGELAAMGISGDYIYAYGGSAQVMCKIKMSDMSLVWAADTSGTLAAFNNGYQTKIVFDSTYLYFTNSNDGQIVQMAK